MAKMRNIIKSTAEYTESFAGFRGIAPEGDNSVRTRLAHCENVYRDYESDTPSAITSVPGYRRVVKLSGEIKELFEHFGKIAVQSENDLYLVDGDGAITPVGSIGGRVYTSFPFEEYTYILDGLGISRLHRSAGAGEVVESAPPPYVPILYRNGLAFEARNLLTDIGIEEFDVVDGREYAMESDHLRYSILDPDGFTCAVCGADDELSGEVSIPGSKRIGGVNYRVEEISDKAFSDNEAITSVRIGEGVRRIGKMAFYGCSQIKWVSTPSSLYQIDDAAFNSCISLSRISLRTGLVSIGNAAFAASLNLKTVHYEGNADELSRVDGYDMLGAADKVYTSVDDSISLYLPLCSKFEAIESVNVGKNTLDFDVMTENGAPVGIKIDLSKHWQYNGECISVRGSLYELKSNFNGSDEPGDISARGIIEGCTISALYDGRVFLSGNPRLPATVFYCSRTRDGAISPLYFGEHNYFNDGSKGTAISAILSVGNGIYVFKGEKDPMGSIFLHKGEDTGIDILPRIYPVHEAYSGELCLGGAIASADAPLFISPRGLCAIEKESTNLERGISTRSSNVSSRLLADGLSGARIFGWMGYIAICLGEKIYLADTRATFTGRNRSTEYEWFIISGVGEYLDKRKVYRYSSNSSNPTFRVKEGYGDKLTRATVHSHTRDGVTYYFTIEDALYAVYPTEEYEHSGFRAAQVYRTVGERLYFASGNTLFVFNNDKRSQPPSEDYLDRMGITEEEYREIFGRRIHPSLYNFDGIAPRYVIRTVRTDCGVPHLTKSSVKGSLCIKLGKSSGALPTVKVTTDKGNFSEFIGTGGRFVSFLDIDFGSLSLSPEMDVTVAVSEKEKDWIEKDIIIFSETTSSPISVHGLSFRYKIKGRIKHT